MGTSRDQLYRERMERIERATELKEPDRVPITPNFSFFAARHAGYTNREIMYDYEKSCRAIIKTTVDFGWDATNGPPGLGLTLFSLALLRDHPDVSPLLGRANGVIHDILGERYGRFPGRELPDDSPFQFIGGEYMKVDEYDRLIRDPTEFITNVIMPRTCRSFERPGSAAYLGSAIKLGYENSRFRAMYVNFIEELKGLGFPLNSSASSYAPLDLIGDYLRDIKNVLLDVFRVPDKVKQACDALTPLMIEYGKLTGSSAIKLIGSPRVFIPLHLNEYLSPKKFDEFYWSTLKEVIFGLVKEGLVPFIFYEGYHDPHLETMLELPRGKTIAWFEKTDLRKAKEVLGGHTCIMGGPPASLLIGGTPAKVEDYMKSLLEDLKPGGGFIVNPAVSGIPDDAKHENVKAMTEAVMRYGVY